MIGIENLVKTYAGNIHALRAINLKIETGLFGLVGPNGAGKTTLMRILAGLLRPTGGNVCVLGHDVTTAVGKQAVKAKLGYLPQELGLYPDLTAHEFLDYIGALKKITDHAARRRQIDELLELVGLSQVADRRMGAYSTGMKRRVGFAQALLGNPQLLIMDEPTAGLDPEERLRLLNLLVEIARQSTVILSTHIIDDVSQRCNDLAVLHDGRIPFRGSPHDLAAQAKGQVWLISLIKDKPPAELTTISALQRGEGAVQYRVLGNPSEQHHAVPAEPSLEDGYLWLMKTLQADSNTVNDTQR